MLDEAALQEAALVHKEATLASEHASPSHSSAKSAYLETVAEHPKSQSQKLVKALEAVVDAENDEESNNDEDTSKSDKKSKLLDKLKAGSDRRHLRASSNAMPPVAAVATSPGTTKAS